MVVEEDMILAVKAAGIWKGDSGITWPDGKTIQTSWTMTRLPDGGMIGTAIDMTEQKQAETEKADLQQQFFQAQKMEAIGRLAGGIAHDFNNILAAINGYAEFLAEDLIDGTPEKVFAQNILQAGRQGRSLVDQMMAFSRRKENVIETIDLLVPVRETLSILGSSLPGSIDIQKSFSVDSAPVEGHATQISQLLMNLCVNARDAMSEDKGVLKIALARADVQAYRQYGLKYADPAEAGAKTPAALAIQDIAPGRTRMLLNTLYEGYEYVSLSVEDTGSGMSRAIMEHIFEPFFTTKPVDKGTGLGLATVHGVVLSHKAVLIVDSIIGQGTRFELLFPLATTQKDVAAQQTKTTEESTSEAQILLVEDQDNVREMMQAMLERMGHTVADAASGLEALAVLREHPDAFDLVISDYNMPKMNGLELVHQASLDFPALPFVIVSGQNESDLEVLAESFPSIVAFLRKPVAAPTVAQTIQKIMAEKASRGRAVA